MLSTSARYLAVMDADLQHDAEILPQMFEALSSGEATVAVGSRYCDAGGIGEWDKTRANMPTISFNASPDLFEKSVASSTLPTAFSTC